MILPLSALLLASAPDPARLHLESCVPQPDLVHDLVAIEIGFERLIDTPARFEVYARCTTEAVQIRLHPNPFQLPSRTIENVEYQQPGGARLIALNIVELLVEAFNRAKAPPKPPDTSKAPKPQTGSSTIAKSAQGASSPGLSVRGPLPAPVLWSMRLGAAPALRYLPNPARVAVGARASLGFDGASGMPVRLTWATQIELGFERSQASFDLGEVQTQALFGAVLGGARLRLWDRLALFGLAGIKGGWAWLSAQAQAQAQPGEGQGPWWGPTASLRLRYGDSWGVALGLEGGWTLYGVFGEVEDSEPVGLRSGWLGADLSVDWRFGGAS